MHTQTQLPAIPAGLPAARLRHADAFLAMRGLDRGGVERLMQAKAGPAEHVLLTSSPVHGLANSTSDLDFIRVQAEVPQTERMATQLFEGGNHLELITFSAGETAQALRALTALAGEAAPAVVLGHRGWDRAHTVRRKYLERLVNGVAMDATMPYLGHLPVLARVWKWSSLHTAAEQAFYLRLAEEAGESRGRLGYAAGALLHLMDATLSHYGHVFSNRKWYLLRWRRFLASDEAASGPAAGYADAIEGLWHQVSAALADGTAAALAPRLADLMGQVFETAGEGRVPALEVTLHGAPQPLTFLPGAQMLLGAASVFVGDGPLAAGTVELTRGATLPGDPGDLLRAARGGALRLLPA
ncbi:MAG TPA: DUF6001 family protein [Streptosporangiaceae bacterium]|nr:DUF6001 family protein [Streptosporangiaceae bacterium]